MDTEQLLTMVIAASVPAAIAYVACRNRCARPIAARLFIAAAICQFLAQGVGMAEQLLGVNYSSEFWDSSEPNNLDLVNIVGDELHPGSPGWQRMIAWQIVLSGFDIAAWSLMAWAILRRPDDRSRMVIVPS